MKEIKVEEYLIEQVELRGGLCEKHVSPGRRGVPDRLVTWRGVMDLVELKKPKGASVKMWQKRDHEARCKRGVFVWVCYTKDDVDRYIRERQHVWLHDKGVRLENNGNGWDVAGAG